MSTLYTERTARKRYACDWCGEAIEPGTRYVRAAAPPWSEGNEDDHWLTSSLHGRFPEDCPVDEWVVRKRLQHLYQIEEMYA